VQGVPGCRARVDLGGRVISALELIFGAALIALVLFDVFLTVVVPRRSNRAERISPYLIAGLWPLWRRYAVRLHPDWRRENFLATFAPFSIVVLLITWVLILVISFGLVLHAMGDDVKPPVNDFGSAIYLAGASLLTIGYGDIVPVGLVARIVVIVAAASGLALLALVISLTFNLYGSFARREVLVLLLDSRAGVPPSGVMMLETFGRQRIVEQLAPTFERYEAWTAEMLDSHLAYPLLPFFRSSHDGQSWISALGAVLDAATLFITVVDRQWLESSEGLRASRAAAEMMYHLGCHALVDLTQYRVLRRRRPSASNDPLIERSEFDQACRALAEAGFPIRGDDDAWRAFSESRAAYAQWLNMLAKYFGSPPTQWIGDRSLIAHLRSPQHLLH
jgi:hypothetical protein